MKTSLLFYLIFMSFSINSCYTYEAQFDDFIKTDAEILAENLPKTLVYAMEGKLYLTDQYGLEAIEITDDFNISKVSINNNHTKILYKGISQNIRVFDIETETVERIIQNTNNIIDFDFHPNNESIYYLKNDNIYVDGPQLYSSNPLDITKNLNFTVSSKVYSAVILPNNEIIMSYGSYNKKLARINEFELLEEKGAETYSFSNLRINHAGNLMTGIEKEGNFSYLRSVYIELDLFTTSWTGASMSLPHSYLADNFGYNILENELSVPGGYRRELFSTPTSIDY